MQPKFTLQNLGSVCTRMLVTVFLLFAFTRNSYSQVLFNEGFDNAIPPSGWSIQNNSNPIGAITWNQGSANAAQTFPANSGAGYASVNFNSGAGTAIISNWMISPNITMKNGDIFTFYTRATTGGGIFPDRLQVRMSTNGASTNVGTTETSVGDFTTLLLDINPTYSSTVYPEVWTQFTMTISGLAGPTSGRVAFRYFVEDGGPNGNNSNYIGIDDAIYTTFAAACSGTPTPGNTLASVPSVCPATNFTLSLQNNPSVSGLTYQWQSAAAVGGPYTNIGGATNATAIVSQNAATYYRCNVTCSGNTAASTPLQEPMSPATSCYCTAGSPDVTFEKISNVTYNTINNNSSSTGPYEDFTAISTTVVQQSSLPMTVSISNGFSTDQIKVWIDFNQNGSFSDPGELVYTSAAGVGPDVGNITIPATSSLGPTRMRVRLYDSGFDPNPGPCGNTSYGQVEDYTVNITPCIQGVFTSQPGNANIQCGSNTSFTVGATGSNLSYQWEYKTSAASTTWLPVTDGGIFSTSTTATLNLNTVPVTYNGYQFRGVITGSCTAVDFSSPATLTVTPLIAVVSPSSATICIGSIQQLTITNITSAPTTTTFSSGAISLAVPDNNPAGVNHTIAISGIPAGAIVTDMNVKLNISHTWVGDMVFVLKAPNGNIFNLDYYLTSTGGAGPTTGFTNTVLGMTGTTVLSAGSDPYTGLFKPDAIVTPIPGFPSGPTGYTPNVSSFNGLTSTMNGNWTLAMYDGGAGDVGTLTNWSISFTYVAPVFATGIWSPAATLFTNAAATVPYTGTPVTTVYAKPTVSTNYSVVVTTATCVSSPTIVPVNVTNPIVGLSAVANKSACVNGNATFSVTTTSGGPLTYQWQQSVDGGVTFTDISGATGSSYTVTGATALMNQYRYRVNVTAAPCGSSTSSVGILTVNPLPVVTLSSSQPQLTPGQSATLTASSVPAAFNATSYSWTYNGAAISGATGNSVTAGIDKLGTYIATVTDVNGCVNSSNAVVISGASSDRLWIYPNPTSGQFQVRLYNTGTPNERREISIINSAGVLVASREFSLTNANGPYLRMDFDMSRLSPGVYVVKVADHFSKKITSGLLVIER